jgi:hypothetical protein
MPTRVRIPLRILGLLLFLGGLAGIVFIVVVGPRDVGVLMGRNCRYATDTSSQVSWCTWQDSLGILRDMPIALLVGAVLLLITRSERDPSAPRRRFAVAGPVAVVALTVLGFAGTQVYAHTWRTVHQVKMVKRIFETPRPKIERPSIRTAQRPTARAPRAPRGLQPGSLLREPALRRALGDLRRAAPDGSRLSMLRVAADRIDAEAVAGSRVVRLRRSWNGPATVVSRQTGAAATPALIAFDRVDARAPGASPRPPRDSAARPGPRRSGRRSCSTPPGCGGPGCWPAAARWSPRRTAAAQGARLVRQNPRGKCRGHPVVATPPDPESRRHDQHDHSTWRRGAAVLLLGVAAAGAPAARPRPRPSAPGSLGLSCGSAAVRGPAGALDAAHLSDGHDKVLAVRDVLSSNGFNYTTRTWPNSIEIWVRATHRPARRPAQQGRRFQVLRLRS